MRRRQFLRSALGCMTATSTLSLLPDPFSAQLRAALAATEKTLVVVFQRGGNDGLNTVIPFGDDDYYNMRPTIAVAKPSTTDLTSARNLDGFFGLHPAMEPLLPLWNNSQLALMPAVQFDDSVSSHFDAQRMIESGSAGLEQDGWLNRYLSTLSNVTPLQGIDFEGFGGHALVAGDIRVSNVGRIFELSQAVTSIGGTTAVDHLAPIYAQPFSAQDPLRSEILAQGSEMLTAFNTIRQIDPNYTPANNAEYPQTRFANELRHTAHLIKSNVGVRVAGLSIEGWDTHAYQGAGDGDGRHAIALADFAQGLAAFTQDMGADMDNVLVLCMTEFGRTVAENNSGGTDHGHAGTWMALGGGVNGGIYLGPSGWPGLAIENLIDERYLPHTLDFRDILGEVLGRFLQTPDAVSVLRGYTPSPVGFLNA